MGREALAIPGVRRVLVAAPPIAFTRPVGRCISRAQMELKQHPLSAAFPAMDEVDFVAMQDDIEDNGQREPITIFEGMVLDGWHRYRACVALGVEPMVVQFAGNDPVSFVRSENFHRRHLTSSQRAAAVLALSDYTARGRQFKGATVAPLPKVLDLAKEAGVSPRTIKDAGAAKRGGMLEAVRDGALTASEAAAIVRGEPKAKPAKVARGKPEPTPKKDPEDVAYFGPSAEEIAEAEAAAADDLSLIHKLIESDDKLSMVVAENNKLRAELAVVKLSRDGYMNRSNELIARVKWLKKKLEKLEAAHA